MLGKTMNYQGYLQDKIGKKVFLKRKSSPNYTIIGNLTEVSETKILVMSDNDTFLVDYEDILTLDIKSRDRRAH